MQAGEVDEIQLTAMIKVMSEYVDHHVNEEQRKIFPRVRRAELELDAMGRELLQRKMELETELQDATIDQSDDDVDQRLQSRGRKGSRGGMAARDGAADEE